MANSTIPYDIAFAAFRVGDNVDKKNENICIARVNGNIRPNTIYSPFVSVKKPKPKIKPLI